MPPTRTLDSSIYVAGHRGLAGSAILRCLQSAGYTRIITRTHAQLDLTDQAAVRAHFAYEKPDYVFLAAAKVGGIIANSTYPAEFIYNNLAIQSNVIHESWRAGCRRLFFLGSSCIYPRDCPQPMKEEYLLTGPLESTNRPYAVAKIAGIETCWSFNRQYGTQFIAVMPTNLYGAGDNYDLSSSHVLPALIRKMHEAKQRGAKEVIIWGTGTPKREFLSSNDLADACIHLMHLPDSRFGDLVNPSFAPLINVGCGEDRTITEIATIVAKVVGFDGVLRFDESKPDGTPRKLLDVKRINSLGWRAKTPFQSGVELVYKDFLKSCSGDPQILNIPA